MHEVLHSGAREFECGTVTGNGIRQGRTVECHLSNEERLEKELTDIKSQVERLTGALRSVLDRDVLDDGDFGMATIFLPTSAITAAREVLTGKETP